MTAKVAQTKNCQFGVNITIEVKKYKTTSDNNGIQRGMFQLRSTPVLPETFFSSIVLLIPNGSFWILPLLHSVSDIMYLLTVNVTFPRSLLRYM
jgi:hypothetical protein